MNRGRLVAGPSAALAGWGAYAPSQAVTNAHFEATLETNDQWIVERTGIRERRRADPGESTATMATEAGAAAIKDAGLTPDDIDLLVLATCTPDQLVPAASAFVSDALGLRCGALDLNAACAGFAYALVVGSSMVATGGVEHILVIGAETLTRFVNYEDRSTAILFGDGAGATVLRAATPAAGRVGLLGWDLGCDGSAAPLIDVKVGGSRLPASLAAGQPTGDFFIRMHGNEVFRRAVRAVVDSASAAMGNAGVAPGDIDVFVPHQANVRIVEAVAARLDIPAEKTVVNIDRYGNTSAASIPLALVEAASSGRIAEGDLVLLAGFGAGMTWASAVVRWGRG